MNKTSLYRCWICDSVGLSLAKASNMYSHKQDKSFVISGSGYGFTGDLYSCTNCGFLQWSEMKEILPFYEEEIEDPLYESMRNSRAIQARKVLKAIARFKDKGSLLDVGAGSGILVEEAIKMGFDAYGIEPSKWFQKKAVELGLPVYLGSLPHPSLKGPYDIVTLIDVIEHVSTPIDLLIQARRLVSKGGFVVVITPDCNSIPARLMRWRWWNYKPGHIGYFNLQTLKFVGFKVGLEIFKEFYRPSLCYPLKFILERTLSYFPRIFQFRFPTFLNNFVIPLDLRDSLMIIYKST